MKNYKLSTVTSKKTLCLSILLDEILTTVLIKKKPTQINGTFLPQKK